MRECCGGKPRRAMKVKRRERSPSRGARSADRPPSRGRKV